MCSRHTRVRYEPIPRAACATRHRQLHAARRTQGSPSEPHLPFPNQTSSQRSGFARHHGEASGVHLCCQARRLAPAARSLLTAHHRHGNRLDAADKTWATNSPTPYDTPLSYGGWLQARTLGAKIASIITEAEAEYQASAGHDSDGTGAEYMPDAESRLKKKRRRFKVALHSSPFLRCIQTSVGISAGLCEPPGTPSPYLRQNRSNSVAAGQAPRPTARRSTASPVLPPTGSEPLVNPMDLKEVTFAHRLFPKLVLRLDPFLGEWLSPDYFETIAPPPSTSVMLDQAKAELLRREDYTKYADPGLQTTPVVQKSNQVWGGGGPLEMVPSMGSALPGVKTQAGYNAPTPHYAISNNMKIPDGYVAHARDACLTVDYQWDSSRPPQNWGDGGAYGEEWTAMHKRFRNGAQRLVEWYAGCENPTDMGWKMPGGAGAGANGASHEEDEEVESVVILVSHGAGCNALIGAITHQPALMDVGVASITLAARKVAYEERGGEFPPVHQLYDLRMTANTDHLRGVVTGSPTTAQTPTFRSRGSTTSSTGHQGVLAPFTYAESYRSTSAGGVGPRGSKVLSGGPTGPARQGSIGLWSPETREEEDDLFPDFDGKKFESPGEEEEEELLALPDFEGPQGKGGEGEGGGLWTGKG